MPERIGKYLLEDLIASGGMAEIYLARTEGIGGFEKVLAVKRLHPHFAADNDFAEMLIHEARVAVQLNHKNICQVFDLEKHEGRYILAMEYIHGRDLSRLQGRFREMGALMPIELALYIMQETCSGLSYAHRKTDPRGQPLGLVHRDISPQNILVSFEGEVKIVDFGIAKASLHASSSESGQIKGKFQYMSPEQARGDRIDARADIFGIGAMLYELVTGARLYDEDDEARLLQRARRGQFLPPNALRSDIPEPLEKIILKALARDVRQRFQSAQDLQLAISHYLHSFTSAPCDSIQLSQIMRRLFEEKKTTHTAFHKIQSYLPEDSSVKLSRDEYQVDGHSSLISGAASAVPDLSAYPMADEAPPTGIVPLEELETFADARPNFGPVDLDALDTEHVNDEPDVQFSRPGWESIASMSAGADGDDKSTAMFDPAMIEAAVLEEEKLTLRAGGGPPETVLDIPTFDPSAASQLKRASLPSRPEAPNLDVSTAGEIDNETSLNLADAAAAARLASGDHPIAPAGRGGKSRGLLIAMIAGGLLLLVGVVLTALIVMDNDDPAPTEETSAPAAPVTFMVYSTPAGAKIIVDGDDTGQQTDSSLELTPGEHTIELTLNGFETHSATVQVEADGLHQPTLAPSSWALEIKSLPPGAPIYVRVRTETRDGQSLLSEPELRGHTPKRLDQLSVKDNVTYEISVVSPGFNAPNPGVVASWLTRETMLAPTNDPRVFALKTPLKLTLADAWVKAPSTSLLAGMDGIRQNLRGATADNPKTRRRRKKKDEAEIDPSLTGALTIESARPGVVYINGESIDLTTPVKDYRLPFGKYKVRLKYVDDGTLSAKKPVPLTERKPKRRLYFQ